MPLDHTNVAPCPAPMNSGGAASVLDYQAVPPLAELGPGYTRLNYWKFVSEGALFGVAMAFIESSTVLPAIIGALGGPILLIALLPVIQQVGFRVSPMLNAHKIDGVRTYKPFLLMAMLIQRLPYGLAAAMLLWAYRLPILALVVVASAPLISGLLGGIGSTSWQQLLVKCVPPQRRHSMFAWRSAITCILGMVVGLLVKRILNAWPGTYGYGMLHLCAFAVLLLSYATFASLREPAETGPAPQPEKDFGAHLSSVLSALRGDRQYLLLLGVLFTRSGLAILVPFLSLHCQAVLNKPASYLGVLVIVQMAGAVLGNAVAGWLGDRFGSKLTLMLGTAVCGGMPVVAALAHSPVGWLVAFFLFGFGNWSSDVALMALGLEMGPREKRATYLALRQLVPLPALLAASFISTALWKHHQFGWQAGLAVGSLALSLVFLIPLREPKHASPEGPGGDSGA